MRKPRLNAEGRAIQTSDFYRLLGNNIVASVSQPCQDAVRRVERLLMVLHHPTSARRLTMALAAYLDESGTDKGSGSLKVATLAGYVLAPVGLRVLESDWERVLEIHEIPYVHMSEFAPNGKFHYFSPTEKQALFKDLAEVIRQNVQLGISVTVDVGRFRRFISENTDALVSPYLLLFSMFVRHVTDWLTCYHPHERISFVLDRGNRYRFQIDKFYNDAKDYEMAASRPHRLGTLTFADDREYCVLQAAGMLAYESRREAERLLHRSARAPSELYKQLVKDVPILPLLTDVDFVVAFGQMRSEASSSDLPPIDLVKLIQQHVGEAQSPATARCSKRKKRPLASGSNE